MKYLNSIIVCLAITVATAVIGCKETAEKKGENVEVTDYKIKEEREEIEKAGTKAEKIIEQSEADAGVAYTTFRLETERILAANEVQMLELKGRMLMQKESAKTQYEKDLEALKKENEKLKANVEAFKYGTKENWEEFKTTVNKDIDRLGKSISAMAEREEKRIKYNKLRFVND